MRLTPIDVLAHPEFARRSIGSRLYTWTILFAFVEFLRSTLIVRGRVLEGVVVARCI
jgi:hypothetical protein